MGRTSTPTALRDVKGMDKKNPGRRNDQEPEPPGGIGPAPKKMPVRQKRIWDEIVIQVANGVMGSSDRIALEILVVLLDDFRVKKGEIQGLKLTRLTSLLSQFGMTPSDRSKIVVPKGQKKNKFGIF